MANRIMLVMTVGMWIFLIVMFSLFGAEQLNRHRLWRAIENEDLAYIENYARRGKDLNVRHLFSRETALLYAIVVSKKVKIGAIHRSKPSTRLLFTGTRCHRQVRADGSAGRRFFLTVPTAKFRGCSVLTSRRTVV